jgi:hypothetical protein
MAATVSTLYQAMLSVLPEKRLIDYDTQLPYDKELAKLIMAAFNKKDMEAVGSIMLENMVFKENTYIDKIRYHMHLKHVLFIKKEMTALQVDALEFCL